VAAFGIQLRNSRHVALLFGGKTAPYYPLMDRSVEANPAPADVVLTGVCVLTCAL